MARRSQKAHLAGSQKGVRGLLIYCADRHCSHSIAISAVQWPDQVRPSDLEPRLPAKLAAREVPKFGQTLSNRSL
jgi:hypothetical protein